jgi:hypothetical protein
MTELNITQLKRDSRICSFDIENMYTNIARKDITNKINDVLNNNTEIQSIIRKIIIYTVERVTEQIIAYYRYVDDIFIICNKNKTNIEKTLNDFNNIKTLNRTLQLKKIMTGESII